MRFLFRATEAAKNQLIPRRFKLFKVFYNLKFHTLFAFQIEARTSRFANFLQMAFDHTSLIRITHEPSVT